MQARRAEVAQLEMQRQSLAQQLETEIQIVLRLLANHGYPNIAVITLKEEAFRKAHTRGGWEIGYSLYLLSNGNIAYSVTERLPYDNSETYTVEVAVSEVNRIMNGREALTTRVGQLRACLEGIHRLRHKLETP